MKQILSIFLEIQRKLEQEQRQRKSAEEKLLEVEKNNSTLTFDYKQVQQQLQSLQIDLRNESEKVKTCNILHGPCLPGLVINFFHAEHN